MTLVTLIDMTPVERFDGVPWTEARIDEAIDADAVAAGTWTPIDTKTLDPVDIDPQNPITREFTTDLGTVAEGWYRVVWIDGSANQSITPPVQNLQIVRDYRPLVSDVAAHIRSRTIDTNGAENGTFTAGTRPTYEQADRVIDAAMRKLEARFGPSMKSELVGSAKEVVSLRAAMMVELGYFGDQIAPGRSPYPQLEKLYEDALADWTLERKELGADDTPDTDDDQSAAGLPSYSFPSLPDPLTGPGPFDGCGGLRW